MAYGESWYKLGLGMSMGQGHFKNFKNYILNPPQRQQQVNQSKGQFILKYRVDVKSVGPLERLTLKN